MKWFKHDSNAHIDAKLKKVKHKYGIVGYGLYWYCIELIAMGVDKNNLTFELEEDSETIAMEWNLDQLKVQEMVQYMVHLNLFENTDGRITCLKLARRLDETTSKNPEIKRVLVGLSSDDNNEPTPLNSGDTPDELPMNSEQIRLDKIRIELKEQFKLFWEVYPRKQKKQPSEVSWIKNVKTVDQALEVIAHVEKRKKQDPQWLRDQGQYIPLPSTFLNQALWNDEYQVNSAQVYTPKAFNPEA